MKITFNLQQRQLSLFSEWSKALLLEKWMSNAIHCCEMAGIAPPNSALQLCAPSPPMGDISSPPLSTIITPPPTHVLRCTGSFDSSDSSGEKKILVSVFNFF